MFTSSEVMPKLTNGKVTPVNGSTARLPATVTASWHDVSTTQATAIQLRSAWPSFARRPSRPTRRGSPRVTRPWWRISRCSHTTAAIDAAHAGRWGTMTALHATEIELVALADAVAEVRRVPVEEYERYGVLFG